MIDLVLGRLPYVVSAWLLLVGLWGVVTSKNLVHLVICLCVVQSSTYLLLLAVGYRAGAVAPIFVDLALGTPAVDPVVQALMLTDVVVEATVLALLLTIVVRIRQSTGTVDPERVHVMRG